jgi:predicted Zn-dependent protease with MMP-like domain
MTDEAGHTTDPTAEDRPLTRREFERLVRKAVRSLPPALLQRIDNVLVEVQPRATPDDLRRAGVRPGGVLFGLYRGVPLTHRGSGYHLVPPDTITIYQEPLQHRYRDPERLVAEIRKTVLHELAHYFGMDEDHLARIGMQ